MRASLGNSLLLYLVVIFSGIVIMFFAGILMYSKAYKTKNRIIEIIEKYGNYDTEAQDMISTNLNEIGYTIVNTDYCSREQVKDHISQISDNAIPHNVLTGRRYNYCVYEITDKAQGNYYVVVTFVNVNFPLIGEAFSIPIYGETKILNKNYNY